MYAGTDRDGAGKCGDPSDEGDEWVAMGLGFEGSDGAMASAPCGA